MITIFEDLLTFENSGRGWGECVGAPFHKASFPKPIDIYLFKVNNRNIRKKCKICSKLTIKSPERCQ